MKKIFEREHNKVLKYCDLELSGASPRAVTVYIHFPNKLLNFMYAFENKNNYALLYTVLGCDTYLFHIFYYGIRVKDHPHCRSVTWCQRQREMVSTQKIFKILKCL